MHRVMGRSSVKSTRRNRIPDPLNRGLGDSPLPPSWSPESSASGDGARFHDQIRSKFAPGFHSRRQPLWGAKTGQRHPW